MKKENIGQFVIEIDETVTKKEVFHIGDPVKVFEKSYGDKYNVYPGIIIGFAKNNDIAAIEVLYLVDEYGHKIKRGLIYDGSKDLSIAHTEVSEFGKSIVNAIESLDNDITKARFELEAAIALKKSFERNFGKAFGLNQSEQQ